MQQPRHMSQVAVGHFVHVRFMQPTSAHYVPDMQLSPLIRDVNKSRETQIFLDLEKWILRIQEPSLVLLKCTFSFTYLNWLQHCARKRCYSLN